MLSEIGYWKNKRRATLHELGRGVVCTGRQVLQTETALGTHACSSTHTCALAPTQVPYQEGASSLGVHGLGGRGAVVHSRSHQQDAVDPWRRCSGLGRPQCVHTHDYTCRGPTNRGAMHTQNRVRKGMEGHIAWKGRDGCVCRHTGQERTALRPCTVHAPSAFIAVTAPTMPGANTATSGTLPSFGL